MSNKKCQIRSVKQECLTKVSSKSVLQECQIRVSSKKCLTRVSSKTVLQECQVRSVLQECLTRVSSKSVSPESCAIVSSKGVLQECHLSVWIQGVSQVRLLEMWQISIVSVCQHTCRHSGSWASSCFEVQGLYTSDVDARLDPQAYAAAAVASAMAYLLEELARLGETVLSFSLFLVLTFS